MVHNKEIAAMFDLLSKLMDIHGENSFKTKTYSTAAYRIEKLPEQLESMDPGQIHSLPGIGEAVTKKIMEILTTGSLPALQEYLEKTPPGIVEMLSIKGIGPKKIGILWKELGIESIGELEYACNENRLIILKGFGAKTQESILKSIAFMQNNKGLYLWMEAEAIANEVMKSLQKTFPENRIRFSGAYRRQLPVIAHVDIVTDLTEDNIKPVFAAIPEVRFEHQEHGLQMTLPNMPSFLFYYGKNTDFHKALFETTATPSFADSFLEKYTIPETVNREEDIFLYNRLPYIPPYLRESEAAIKTAEENKIPSVLQTGDIKGIIHAHSTWSDGVDSLEQMATTARDKGYEYLVISDHSQSAFYAKGLKPEQIVQQHAEINLLNEKLAPFRILKSIEADILYDGRLDYTDDILATFDLIIASVHSNLKMTEEKAMQRILAAIQNPFTTILGHPTGRLLLSREGYPVDHKTLIDACVAHNVVIEINAHPRRLDLDWNWISYALEKGAMLSLNPDAHSVSGMDMVKYGVLAAQKGGLTKERNLSSQSLAGLLKWLEE